MTAIAPCITAENTDDYTAMVKHIEPFAERVHIDVSDGEFAPNFLVGVGQLFWPKNWQVDVHAMVARPSEYVQSLAELHPSMIIFHVEVEEDLTQVLQYIKQVGIKAGIALKRETVPKTVAPLIEAADHVLIFSGDLGHFGGKASLMQLEKVRLIRAIHPSVEIGWDGGASIENAFSLSQGGIDVINTGGAIQNADEPESVYKAMQREIKKQSVI